MQKQQITVMVRMKTKSGLADRLKKAALSIIPQTRQEPGCIDYYFHVDEKDHNTFMFYENWIDHQSLAEHLEMPYLKEFQRVLDEVLEEKEEFTLWKIIE